MIPLFVRLIEQRFTSNQFGRSPSIYDIRIDGYQLTGEAPAALDGQRRHPIADKAWQLFRALARIRTAYRRKMQVRRDTALLHAMDDYLLRDIGLTRWDIEAAVEGHLSRAQGSQDRACFVAGSR